MTSFFSETVRCHPFVWLFHQTFHRNKQFFIRSLAVKPGIGILIAFHNEIIDIAEITCNFNFLHHVVPFDG